MEDILFSKSETTTIAYMSAHGVAVEMEVPKPPAAQPTTGTIIQLNVSGGPLRVAYWGLNNDFPNEVRRDLHKDAEMLELINRRVLTAYGKGIVCLNEIDRTPDGEPIYEAIKDWNVVNWYRSPQTRKYCMEGFLDLFTFSNVFPELITTRDRSQIYSVGVNEAMHCRWQLMDDDGKLKTVIHNKNWPWGRLDDPYQTTILPAIDPYDYDIVNTVKQDKSLKKFIYPLNYPSIGQTYYQVSNWNALRVSGWMAIAAKVPEFMLALMVNQMTIKYLIRIPNAYWPSVFKNWDKYSETVQNEKKKEKLAEINKSLTDAKNAGKSILNEVGIDPVTKEKIPGWEIVVIDDKTKPGAYIPTSAEASSHKMRGLGIDPTLPGTLDTGSGMSGTGSDKQLAWNIDLATIDLYREIILDPLYFKAKFDDGIMKKWPGFTLKFRDSIMETVNGHNTNVKGGLT